MLRSAASLRRHGANLTFKRPFLEIGPLPLIDETLLDGRTVGCPGGFIENWGRGYYFDLALRPITGAVFLYPPSFTAARLRIRLLPFRKQSSDQLERSKQQSGRHLEPIPPAPALGLDGF